MDNQEGNIFVTLWKEKRIVSIAFFIAFSQFQYGFDSAVVSGFQGMAGFLAVFRYVDVSETSQKLFKK
jgi:SP family sugar:H+ symporter-like MFS transporter